MALQWTQLNPKGQMIPIINVHFSGYLWASLYLGLYFSIADFSMCMIIIFFFLRKKKFMDLEKVLFIMGCEKNILWWIYFTLIVQMRLKKNIGTDCWFFFCLRNLNRAYRVIFLVGRSMAEEGVVPNVKILGKTTFWLSISCLDNFLL